MKNYLKSCLALTIIFSLVYSPVVIQQANATQTRDEFNEVCKKALSDVESKKSTQGDQHMAYCVQADLARRAKNVETTKSVIFLTAASVCTALAIWENIPYFSAEAKAICMGASIGGAVAGIGADIAGKTIINNKKKQYGESKDKICSFSTFTPVLSAVAPILISGSTSSGSSASDNSGCLPCAISMGLTGALSISQSVSSKNSQKSLVEDAKGLRVAGKDSVTNLSPASISLASTQADPVSTGNNATSGATQTTDTCENKSGNQYLSCVGQFDPELSAITNSPEFMSSLTKSLHGKNVGDFVKGYHGDTTEDLANYVAAGTGTSPAFVAKLIEQNGKFAKDTGFLDHYSPLTYARGSSGGAKSGEDLDFNKIMAGMMGKLDPGAAKDGKSDPSELVFRQLELLPADKIEANKDISLFARIAFRYRKNSSNVEQLNWSGNQNQGPAPASMKK